MYFTGVSAILEREGVAKTGISRIKNDLDLYLTGVLIVGSALLSLATPTKESLQTLILLCSPGRFLFF